MTGANVVNTTVTVRGREIAFVFDPESWVHRLMRDQVTAHGYEPGTWALMHAILREGDTVIDVGAHIGVFSCLAAALVGPTGHVTAFEPDPVNFSRLAYHKRENQLDQLELHRAVIGDAPGLVNFYVNADNDGGHCLWEPGAHGFNEKTRAQQRSPVRMIQTRLDDYALSPKLIKIDTEGAELRVLRGAERLLDTALLFKPAPFVIAECNGFGLSQLGDSEPALVEFMESRAYTAHRILDDAPFTRPRNAADAVNAQYVYNLLFVPPGAEVPTCAS